MDPYLGHKKKRPEAKIQDAIIRMLTLKSWYVHATHGGMYQSGFPDLFCTHKMYGHRWVEVKLPGMKGSRFTLAQLDQFPKMCAFGSGVWVLTAATPDEYQKLFKDHNWFVYLM